jgi:rhomboid protease GluP
MPQQVAVIGIPNFPPVVTYTVIGLTVLVYLAQIGTLYWLEMDIPGALGAKINEAILAGQFWRLFTPMLLHDDRLPIHILSNMYFLAIVGARLEKLAGHGRFLLLYVAAGFAGNVCSFLFSVHPAWGASTALFGLMGAEAVFALQNRSMLADNGKAALQNVLTLAGMNVVIGIMVGADNWGHIGGLLGGLAFAWFGGVKFEVRSESFASVRVEDMRGWSEQLTGAAVVFITFGALAALKILGLWPLVN